MKIDKVESFLIGHGNLVRIETDNGLVGWGNTACWGYPEAVGEVVKVFAEYLVGENPLRIEHHWQYLYRMGPFKGSVLCGAVSAVDIALWDIKGKHFEAPAWELLGGNCRDKIRLHLLGGASTPEDMTTATKQAVDQGFTALKFDPIVAGFQDMAVDRLVKTARDITAAAREAGGPDLDLIVEIHRKLTPLTGVTVAEALSEFNLLFVEDPIQIDSINSQADVARRINVPIGNGERLTTIWEFRELLERGGPQYVRPDVAMAGGLSHCKKIAAIAEAHHCAVATHNFLDPLISAASFHLDTSIPNFVTQEYTTGDEGPKHAMFNSSWKRDGGYVPVSDRPGLGVEVNEDLIEQTPYARLNNASTPLCVDGSVAYSV